ncbi:MAG: glycosyltransferase [Candidatus Woesearchaeota archaeon]|nr:glycosyltransferase [Candidatus Woesearchaeota archaeon]
MEISTIVIWVAYFISLYLITFWLLVFLEKGSKDLAKGPLTYFPFISITVPAYNEEKTIKKTIDSLLNLNYPKDKYEILVVNDGSTDKTKDIVLDLAKKHSIINLINQTNHGKGSALNHAIRKSKGEFFVCLDADSTIENDALLKMLPHFDDPSVAAVLPRIKVAEGSSNFIRRLQWFEYTNTFFYKKLMSNIDCVHVTPGPFALYKKDILIKVGYFDEHNLTEDLEMAFKLQKSNYKIIQLLDVNVYTNTPQNMKQFYKQRNRWYKGSFSNVINYRHMVFNRKYGEFGLLQMPMILISAFLSIIVFSIIGYYYFFKPIYKSIHNLSFINFNIEKISEIGFKTPLYYLFIYPLLVFFIWCIVLYQLLTGKKQRW